MRLNIFCSCLKNYALFLKSIINHFVNKFYENYVKHFLVVYESYRYNCANFSTLLLGIIHIENLLHCYKIVTTSTFYASYR